LLAGAARDRDQLDLARRALLDLGAAFGRQEIGRDRAQGQRCAAQLRAHPLAVDTGATTK
jgi:hypothetical protein